MGHRNQGRGSMSSGGFELNASDFLRGIDLTQARTRTAARNGMQDSVDDLKRIAVDIAPIKSSDLRRSSHAEVRSTPGGNIVGEVSFRAVENGFNYALWTHEGEYNLGEQSQQAPGTDGYEVGNKYLERPLRGESEKYMRWIAEEIRDVVGD